MERTRGVFFAVLAFVAIAVFMRPERSLAAQFQVDASGTLTNEIVSYWNMEGNSNDFYHNDSGSDTAMTYTTSPELVGENAYFDGVSSTIETSENVTNDTSQPISIALWYYYPSGYSGVGYIKSNGTVTYGDFGSFILINDPTGEINAGVFKSGYTSANDISTSLSANAWHFIVLTYTGDNSTNGVKLYIDSSSTAAEATWSTTGANTNSNPFWFGATDGGGSLFLSGDLDEVGTWNRVLTPTEIGELWNNGTGQTMIDGRGPYYAQIQNVSTLNLRDGTSTSANILKTLPADWIMQVVTTTDQSGNPIINDGDMWYGVIDPTDGVTGWMAASDTSYQYISSYDGSAQAGLEASSSDVLSTTSTRAAAIVDAVQNYYTNSSTVSSLYTDEYADSSANLSDIFNLSNATSVPEVLVYGMAARESGIVGLDNTNVKPISPGYGYGIMQLTEIPTSSDIYNLQVLLNKNSSTQIAVSGTSSPGMENGDFTSAVSTSVEIFQNENGIASTGFVGFLTRSALNLLLPTSGISSYFHFNINLQQGDDDWSGDPRNPIGQTSGVTVPPCDNLQDPSTSTYYQNCLGESSTSTPNQYYAPQSYYDNQTFFTYGNTYQSIYANIKDALGVMRTKWQTWLPCYYGDLDYSAPGFATTTFSCNDRLSILSVWGYNGFTTSSYLSDVADKLNGENIQNLFPTAGISTSTSAEWYNKLKIGQANEFQFEQDSPVDSAVVDSEGRVTGIVDGKLEVQIPDSAYDTRTHSGIVLFPQDTYTFRIQGDATGTYGFTVQSNDHSPTSTVFQVNNFPTSPGAIHEYSIDFKKLEKGEPGVTLKIDDQGNGKIDRVLTDVGTVSIEPAQTYPASLLTPPVIQQPSSTPKPPVRIFESIPLIPTSTAMFTSSTPSMASSTIATSSSLVNFTSTLELASSTIIQNNSSTENNE